MAIRASLLLTYHIVIYVDLDYNMRARLSTREAGTMCGL